MRKVIGVSLVVIVAMATIGIFVWRSDTSHQREASRSTWNNQMVAGSDKAPHKIIEYSDYFCEYCADFHEQVSSSRFQNDYISPGLVQVETRIVTVLSARSPNTNRGAEAAFCAADQGKFTAYSNSIIPRIKKDFFDKGVGVSNAGTYKPIMPVSNDYFLASARAAELDEGTFISCMERGQHRKEIGTNTEKALQLGVQGLPSISVNGRMFKGFTNGWSGFTSMLKAGGVDVK